MNPPQDKYIQVERIKTRYWAEGEGETAAVFIHGIGGSIEPWLSSFTSLASRQPVYAMDLMGHGLTDKPMDISYNVSEFATFIKNFMAALPIKHAHIVGHSMGGAIALRFTLMFPEMVDKLVLVSSAGLGKAISPALRICAIPFLGEALTHPSLTGTGTSQKTLVYDPAVITKESINLNYKMACLPGAQKAFLRILRTNFSPLFGQIGDTSMAELGTIKNPVLVIWGKQDHTIPVAHSDSAANYLPDVHTHIFDHCGHLPMLEHEQEFNGLLSDFLSY